MNRKDRKLTGNWYIKKTLFGFKIMVEVIKQKYSEYDYSFDYDYLVYEKATTSEIRKLGIKINN